MVAESARLDRPFLGTVANIHFTVGFSHFLCTNLGLVVSESLTELENKSILKKLESVCCNLLAKGVEVIEKVGDVDYIVKRDLSRTEIDSYSDNLREIRKKLNEPPPPTLPIQIYSTSTPEKSRTHTKQPVTQNLTPILPTQNIENQELSMEISNVEAELSRLLESDDTSENLPAGRFNLFDVNAACWMDGSSVGRTNKPRPESDFPHIPPDKDQSADYTKFVRIISTNVPCKKCETSDRLLHSVIHAYPDFEIYCYSEMYIKDSNLKIPKGFKILKNDTSIHCAIILYREKIANRIKILEPLSKNFVSCSVKTGNLKSEYIKLHCGYRSPNYGPLFQNFFCRKNEFEKNFDSLMKTNEATCIVGDLNLKITNKYSKFRQGEEKLAEIVKNRGFFDYVDGKPTHKSTVNTVTCTDVILTNFAIENCVIDETAPCKELDHYPISFEFRHHFGAKTYNFATGRGKIYEEDEKGEKTEKFKDLRKIGRNLAETNDSSATRENAIQVYEDLKMAVDLVQPIRTSLIKTGRARLGHSKDYYILKNRMDEIWKKDRKNCMKNPIYKDLRKKCVAMRNKEIRIRREKEIGERVLKNRGNWAKLDNLNPYESSIPPQICANKLALHFQNLSYNYIEKVMQNPIKNFDAWLEKMSKRSNKFEFCLPLEIGSKKKHLDIRYHLDSNKGSCHAVSTDGISREFLRFLPPEFGRLFDMMISVSMATGEYMKGFRQMKGFAVFKKGDRNEVKNYRPILVCSQVAACCEKMAIVQMQRWAETSGFYHKFQMGFREKFSIGSLINQLKLDCFKKSKKLHQSVLLNDLSNAFGSCDDMKIVDELSEIFGCGPSRFWRSFLIQTTVVVENGGKKSIAFATAPRGYPQGSVASPGSFLLLMKKLHDNKYGDSTYSFADDTTTVQNGENKIAIETTLQDWLNKFKDFCENLNIKINAKKTNLCHLKIGNKKPENLQIEVNDERVEAVRDFNLLGVQMNEKLNMKNHWTKTATKMKQKGGQIIRTGNNFNPNFNRDMITGYLHGTTGHCLDYLPIPDKNDSGRLNAKINDVCRERFCTFDERRNRVSIRKMKQYELLGRCDLMSIDNQSRQSRLLRLNKIAMTGYPLEEFKLLIECFEVKNETRQNKGIPMLTHRPAVTRRYNHRIHECQPYDAIEELNKLPLDIKKHFATPRFELIIKKTFRTICQHSERNEYFCDNCGTGTGTLRSGTIGADNLRKMIIGGRQIKRWTKSRPLLKPEEINAASFNFKNFRDMLKNRSLQESNRFLNFCKEVDFWRNSS